MSLWGAASGIPPDPSSRKRASPRWIHLQLRSGQPCLAAPPTWCVGCAAGTGWAWGGLRRRPAASEHKQSHWAPRSQRGLELLQPHKRGHTAQVPHVGWPVGASLPNCPRGWWASQNPRISGFGSKGTALLTRFVESITSKKKFSERPENAEAWRKPDELVLSAGSLARPESRPQLRESLPAPFPGPVPRQQDSAVTVSKCYTGPSGGPACLLAPGPQSSHVWRGGGLVSETGVPVISPVVAVASGCDLAQVFSLSPLR